MTAEDRSKRAEKDVASEAPRRPRWGRRVLLGLLVLLVVAGVALFVAVQHRLDQRSRGEGVVQAPSEFAALEGSTGRTGAFTASIDFTSMATGAETISTEVAWDDEWFFQDPTAYNHELATTCSVLSAVANSESAYYQAGSSSPAYMEQALAELGFEEISTASYQYRSEIFDEVVDRHGRRRRLLGGHQARDQRERGREDPLLGVDPRQLRL